MSCIIRRRELFKILAKSGLAISVADLLIACGRDQGEKQFSRLAESTVVPDILVNQCGVIPKEFIVGQIPITLFFREPSHKHKLMITGDHHRALLNGERLRVTTERASGHAHTVTLDLSNRSESDIGPVYGFGKHSSFAESPVSRPISADEIRLAKPLSLHLKCSGKEYPFTVSTADLCALRAGIVVDDIVTDEVDNESFTVVLDPGFAPSASSSFDEY